MEGQRRLLSEVIDRHRKCLEIERFVHRIVFEIIQLNIGPCCQPIEDGGPDIAGGLLPTAFKTRLLVETITAVTCDEEDCEGSSAVLNTTPSTLLATSFKGNTNLQQFVDGLTCVTSKSCDTCQWSAQIRKSLAAGDFVVIANTNRKPLRHVGRITNRTITIGEKSYEPEVVLMANERGEALANSIEQSLNNVGKLANGPVWIGQRYYLPKAMLLADRDGAVEAIQCSDARIKKTRTQFDIIGIF
ncbi:unnamed protein product [Caenorhabditis nigoni]